MASCKVKGKVASCRKFADVLYTDKTVIEDEEGLKSVDRLVQSEWLGQTSHMGYHFAP